MRRRKQPQKKAPVVVPSAEPDAWREVQSVDLFSMFKPEFTDTKLYYIPISSAPSLNKRYYLSDFPEIDKGKIIGIEFCWNIQPLTISGILYNPIGLVEAKQVQVSIYDKNNEPILYRSPLASFIVYDPLIKQMELKDYSKLEISTGQSYLEFVQSVWITPFPIVIPLRFIY